MAIDNNLKGVQLEIESAKAKMWKQGINPESSAGQRLLKGMLDAIGFDEFLQNVRKRGLFTPINP